MLFLKPVAAYQYANTWGGSTNRIPVGTFWSSSKEAFRWFAENNWQGYRFVVVERVWREKKHGKFLDPEHHDYFGIFNPQLAIDADNLDYTDISCHTRFVPVALWSQIDRDASWDGDARPWPIRHRGVEYSQMYDDNTVNLHDFRHRDFIGFEKVDAVIDAWHATKGWIKDVPRLQGHRVYHYRNLSAAIRSNENLWCVTGIDNVEKSSGVLEWCYDERDALALYHKMLNSKEFSELKCGRWKEAA